MVKFISVFYTFALFFYLDAYCAGLARINARSSVSAIKDNFSNQCTVTPPSEFKSALMGDLSEILSILSKKCRANIYTTILGHYKNITPAISNQIWKLIENHSILNMNQDADKLNISDYDFIEKIKSSNTNCNKKCENESINAIYESFISKRIIQSVENKRNGYESIKMLYDKIFNKLPNSPRGISQLNAALNSNFPYPGYPVDQWKRRSSVEKFESFISRKSIPINLFVFLADYKSARYLMGPQGLIKEQNNCYNRVIDPQRGHRTESDVEYLTKESGIAIGRVSVPSLILNSKDDPWEHSATRYEIKPRSSRYLRSAEEIGLPVACGVSGTTNITLWSLLSMDDGVNSLLNANEMRLFLLSVWATLCADGGHTLQEVLSAAKYVSKEASKNKNLKGNRNLSILQEITKDLSASGDTLSTRRFGHYYDDFFKQLETEYPWFKDVKMQAQDEFIQWHKTSECGKL